MIHVCTFIAVPGAGAVIGDFFAGVSWLNRRLCCCQPNRKLLELLSHRANRGTGFCCRWGPENSQTGVKLNTKFNLCCHMRHYELSSARGVKVEVKLVGYSSMLKHAHNSLTEHILLLSNQSDSFVFVGSSIFPSDSCAFLHPCRELWFFYLFVCLSDSRRRYFTKHYIFNNTWQA